MFLVSVTRAGFVPYKPCLCLLLSLVFNCSIHVIFFFFAPDPNPDVVGLPIPIQTSGENLSSFS